MAVNEQENSLDGPGGFQLCPVCRKLFLSETGMYKHIIDVHKDGEYLSYNLQATLYQRWQGRYPHFDQ